jgi:hypothetical protein
LSDDKYCLIINFIFNQKKTVYCRL